MYILTDHAKRMMKARKITQEDVKKAVESGELEFTKIDEKGRGTERYQSIELKGPFPRKIVVGWAYEGENIKVITVYEIKRKWR
ncbi:MAG: DUF4258 domain-containing protein [Candidatus Hydrothermarchaeota archaeon]|nr:DUF4258 domain-containing protein [Candidatus Hydrothermarchaeota archaeon]